MNKKEALKRYRLAIKDVKFDAPVGDNRYLNWLNWLAVQRKENEITHEQLMDWTHNDPYNTPRVLPEELKNARAQVVHESSSRLIEEHTADNEAANA